MCSACWKEAGTVTAKALLLPTEDVSPADRSDRRKIRYREAEALAGCPLPPTHPPWNPTCCVPAPGTDRICFRNTTWKAIYRSPPRRVKRTQLLAVGSSCRGGFGQGGHRAPHLAGGSCLHRRPPAPSRPRGPAGGSGTRPPPALAPGGAGPPRRQGALPSAAAPPRLSQAARK